MRTDAGHLERLPAMGGVSLLLKLIRWFIMIYFTSDQHFGHKNIIKLCNRPFNSLEEMDESIIENWNNVVKSKDTIYVLGDFAWKKGFDYSQRLNGNKIFLLGDHDKQVYGEKLLIIKMEGIWFVLCHWPLYSWNKQNYNSIHLHGHIHNNIIDFKKNRINVSVDVTDFKPLSLEEILKRT